MSTYDLSKWTCAQLQYAIYASNRYPDPNRANYLAAYQRMNCVPDTSRAIPSMPLGYKDPSPNGNNGGGSATPPIDSGTLADGSPDPAKDCAGAQAWYLTQFNNGKILVPLEQLTNYVHLMTAAGCQVPGGGKDTSTTPVTGHGSVGVLTPPATYPPDPGYDCDGAKAYLATLIKQGQVPGVDNAKEILAYKARMKNAIPPCDQPDVGTGGGGTPTVTNCDTLYSLLQNCKDNGDCDGWDKAMEQIKATTCSTPQFNLPLDWGVRPVCKVGPFDDDGNNIGGAGGNSYVPTGGDKPSTPTVCGSDGIATLEDWLVTFPATGIVQHPFIGGAFIIVGAVGTGVTLAALVPELMVFHAFKWPAILLGGYGGMIVNGALANFDLFGDISKYGFFAGSILSTLSLTQGVYASLRTGEEKLLQTALGAKVGEIVYKVAMGPLGFATDILFKDKTWTKHGYEILKCKNNCNNPKLNYFERITCKAMTRFDIHWKF